MVSLPKERRNWDIFGETIIGAKHKRDGKCNQDSLSLYYDIDKEIRIISIADGHGGSNHFRSDRGSRLAVRSVNEIFCENYSIFNNQNVNNTGIYDVKLIIIEKLLKRWRSKVAHDILIDPIQLDEIERLKLLLKEEEFSNIVLNPLSVYGTTLMSAMKINDLIVVIKIGDGDVLSISKGGNIRKVFFDENELPGEETFSLSTVNVVKATEMTFIPLNESEIEFIMLSTDGYSKSFNSENGFKKAAFDINSEIKEIGVNSVRESLKGWLKETSELGSGDDITVGFLFMNR